MSYRAYLVQTMDHFEEVMNKFERVANIYNSDPPTYVCGLDAEGVNIDCDRVGFERVVASGIYAVSPKQIAITYIQLATKGMVVVIDLCRLLADFISFKAALPSKLVKILTHSNWKLGGVGIGQDIHYLAESFNLGHCRGIIDLQPYAIMARLEKSNLHDLDRCVGGSGKLTGHYNWTIPIRLKSDAFKYACQDAIASYNLNKFASDLITTRLQKRWVVYKGDEMRDNETEVGRTDHNIEERGGAGSGSGVKAENDAGSGSGIGHKILITRVRKKRRKKMTTDWVSQLNAIAQSPDRKGVTSIPVPNYVKGEKKKGMFITHCTYHPLTHPEPLKTVGTGKKISWSKQMAAREMIRQLQQIERVPIDQISAAPEARDVGDVVMTNDECLVMTQRPSKRERLRRIERSNGLNETGG